MSLIQSLLVLVLVAHLLGHLAARLRQPVLLGHMLAGLALGPMGLDWVRAGAGLGALADLAVLFVVISAGLEMRLRPLLQTLRGRRALALLPGFLLPLLAGWAFARLSGSAPVPALVVALCVAVTALPVAVRILDAFGMLDTPIARVAISGALVSDVLVLLALGALSPADTSASASSLGFAAFLKLVGLIALVVAGSVASTRLMAFARRAGSSVGGGEAAPLLLALTLILAIAAASEALGFHGAIGAFLAALLLREPLEGTDAGAELRRSTTFLTAALFGPLFLAYQGLQFLPGGSAQVSFALGLIAVAIGSKLLGGYVTGRLAGLAQREAAGVAIIMNARGVMEMVIASIAHRAGLIDPALFSTLLLMGVVTTACTPLLLGWWGVTPNRSAATARSPTLPPRP